MRAFNFLFVPVEQLEKKIKINGSDPVQLFGFNDAHLRLLEDRFDATIIARGDSITLKGESGEVNLLERILRELMFVLQKTGSLTKDDVMTVIDLFTSDSKVRSESEDYDTIVLFAKNAAIRAKSTGQMEYIREARRNDILFVIGPAGTGKTYLAVAMAVAALKSNQITKIVLVRPAVEAGESLGFLPGDLREKVDPYLRPLYDALEDMLPVDKLKMYLERGTIEIVPLAYMRGRTLNNAFIILDEAQNSTSMQMKMCLTRMGANSKAIITGDITQIDLPPRTVSGLVEIQDILKRVEGVSFIYLDKTDVVRHKLVKDIIEAYEKFRNDEQPL